MSKQAEAPVTELKRHKKIVSYEELMRDVDQDGKPHIDFLLRQKIHELVQALFAQRINNRPEKITLWSKYVEHESQEIPVARAVAYDDRLQFSAKIESVDAALERLVGKTRSPCLSEIITPNNQGISDLFEIRHISHDGYFVDRLELARIIPVPDNVTRKDIVALQVLGCAGMGDANTDCARRNPTHAQMCKPWEKDDKRKTLQLDLYNERKPEEAFASEYDSHLLRIPNLEQTDPPLREIIEKTKAYVREVRKKGKAQGCCGY